MVILMARIVVVTGSPGVGKTTLVKSLGGDPSFRIMSVADEMLPLAAEKGWAKHRDELRYMDNEQITTLRNYAFEKIAASDGNVIIDTHATVEQNGRYVPGLPGDAMEKFKGLMAGIIYIDASTDDILARRESDKERVREKEARHIIHMQRAINISALSYYSSYLNVPLYVVTNRQGRLDESMEKFKSCIYDAFKVKK